VVLKFINIRNYQFIPPSVFINLHHQFGFGEEKIAIGNSILSEIFSVVTRYTNGFSNKKGTVKFSSYISGGNAYLKTVSNHPLVFIANDATVPITLAKNGNAGINTTSPQLKLDVKGRIKVQNGSLGNIITTPEFGLMITVVGAIYRTEDLMKIIH